MAKALPARPGPSAHRSRNSLVISASSPIPAAAHRTLDVVHRALSPRVALLYTDDVQNHIVRANGFQSLVDLLKPFQDSVGAVTTRTSQLEPRQCPSFPLRFDDLDDYVRGTPRSSAQGPAAASASGLSAPSPPSPARRGSGVTFSPRAEVVLDRVSSHVTANIQGWLEEEQEQERVILFNGGADGRDREPSDVAARKAARRKLDEVLSRDGDELAPWFADMKHMVLASRQCSSHESFGWPTAALLVVSSNSPDPMNAFANLYEASQGHVHAAFRSRPYMDPDILRYYVIMHDVSRSGPELTESMATLDNIKRTYGLNCCLLPINSRHSSSSRDPQRSPDLAQIWSKALARDPRLPLEKPDARTSFDVPPPPPPKEPRRRGSGHHGEADAAAEGETAETAAATSSSTTLASSGDGGGGDENAGMPSQTSSQAPQELSALLGDEDVQRLKSFVRELAAQGLIPWMERCVQIWNDKLAASRKGLAGRLLGAGRNFFGSASSKGGSGGTSQPPSFANLGYYAPSTIEAQTRRLADFAFAIRDYKLAAAMYDIGRKDFANDRATKHVGGANEMFGLSHLLIMLTTASPPIDVDSYLAAACAHYHRATRPRGSAMQLDSLRAVLLYHQVYRGLGFYKSAPSALARLADEGPEGSEADLEVVAAMLLEQAADACVRQQQRPALRRCAMYLVRAAHRYRSCGQKLLSLRCLRQAASIYRSGALLRSIVLSASHDDADVADEDTPREVPLGGRKAVSASEGDAFPVGWSAIHDHVEHELGQQALADGRAAEAIGHLVRLIRRPHDADVELATAAAAGGEALAALQQRQGRYLDELVTASEVLTSTEGAKDVAKSPPLAGHRLPVPLFDARAGTVRTRGSTDVPNDAAWQRLREAYAEGVSKPGEALAEEGENAIAPGAPFWVDVTVANPLYTSLLLTDVGLEFVKEQSEASDQVAEECSVEKVDDVTLGPLERRVISLRVSASTPGTYRCARIFYNLAGRVRLTQSLSKRGKRLNGTKQQRSAPEPQYGPDRTLAVLVQRGRPSLEAEIVGMPPRLGLGEECQVTLALRNVGTVAVSEVRMLADPATMFASTATDGPWHVRETASELVVENHLHGAAPTRLDLPAEGLAAGATCEVKLHVRGVALGGVTGRLLVVPVASNALACSCRVQVMCQVEPVLDLAVQARPDPGASLSYSVGVQAVNLLKGEMLELQSVTVVSPSWTAQRKASESGFAPIPPQQRIGFSVQVEETDLHSPRAMASVSGEQNTTMAAFPVLQLQRLLRGEKLEPDARPPKTALHRHVLPASLSGAHPLDFYGASRLEWRRSAVAQEFPTLTPKQRLATFELVEPGEVDLVVAWRLARSQRHGQAFVFGLRLGPNAARAGTRELAHGSAGASRSLYEQTMREKAVLLDHVLRSRLALEENPIMAELSAPESTEHDFSVVAGGGMAGGPCYVEVDFALRNLSRQRTISYVLQLHSRASEEAPPPSTEPSTSPMQAPWVGRLTSRATLAPREMARFSTRVALTSPGTWELGSWTIQTRVLADERVDAAGPGVADGDAVGAGERAVVAQFVFEQRSARTIHVRQSSAAA